MNAVRNLQTKFYIGIMNPGRAPIVTGSFTYQTRNFTFIYNLIQFYIQLNTNIYKIYNIMKQCETKKQFKEPITLPGL